MVMPRSRAPLVLACSALASCTSRHDPAGHAGLDTRDVPAWRARLVQERSDRDREYATSPTSPVAGVERFAPTGAAHIAIDGATVRMDDRAGPDTRVSFQPLDAQRWTWQAAAEVAATTADGKTRLPPGEITQPVTFRLSDRFHLVAQRSGNAFVVTAFDGRRKELTEFTRLAYFEPAPRFVVPATLERFTRPGVVDLATSRGLTKPYERYGALRFTIDGRPCSLIAFHMAGTPERALFVPFRDTTSGKESYGAARFLDLEAPADGSNQITLDFNEAYNPLCAYSPAWNCTLPPPENELAVAITAGERSYGHASH
jgi:uncharacterized protein (DUF1684 family)